jgi:selenide,water dikinase
VSEALKHLKPSEDPNLLVGFETSDDAAVYRVAPDLAFISTVDFITPPVDDPYWFGQIAAANALSDIYAMGGKPLTALNLVMYPSEKLPLRHLTEILRGGHDKVIEAGASMAGGHTVDDNEPKYGLAVTGIVHPDRIYTNCGAQPGDILVLTKPLGTGVLFNACRSGKLRYKKLEPLLPMIASLNEKAMEITRGFDIHACTDITGFGIAGHAFEMAAGSTVQVTLDFNELPLYPNALKMYKKGETTRSNRANRKMSKGALEITTKLSKEEEEILFDPQTSGGLLIAIPEMQVQKMLKKLKHSHREGVAIVGKIEAAEKPRIKIQ